MTSRIRDLRAMNMACHASYKSLGQSKGLNMLNPESRHTQAPKFLKLRMFEVNWYGHEVASGKA